MHCQDVTVRTTLRLFSTLEALCDYVLCKSTLTLHYMDGPVHAVARSDHAAKVFMAGFKDGDTSNFIPIMHYEYSLSSYLINEFLLDNDHPLLYRRWKMH